MSRPGPARPVLRRARRRRLRVAAVALLLVTVVAALAGRQLAGASSWGTAATLVRGSSGAAAERPRGSAQAAGAVPAGTTVFDDAVPGVARLDPELRRALRRAATDAAADGARFVVDSGWRSRAYQARLLREAVARYGSAAEAARWVASPDRSAHVSGDAVDLAHAEWLAEHGAAYGLCRVYANEPWHFERRPDAVRAGCPPPYPDPTYDPRLRR